MPLSEFETTALNAACRHLELAHGGIWRIDRVLEDEIRSEPVPEALLTNGLRTAAIEVKDLAFELGRGIGVQESLARQLLPSCGGSYTLYLGAERVESLDRASIRKLRKEIARLAPSMASGESVSIPVPRTAKAIYLQVLPGHAWCCHHTPYEALFGPLVGTLPGSLFFQDLSLPAHNFVTDSVREQFLESLRRIAHDIAAGRSPSGTIMNWFEEGELTCNTREPSLDDGVVVVNALVSAAVDVKQHARAEVRKAVTAALRKFPSAHHWAEWQMLVLGGHLMTRTVDVADSLAHLETETDMSVLDEVLLLVDGSTTRVWPLSIDRPRSP